MSGGKQEELERGRGETGIERPLQAFEASQQAVHGSPACKPQTEQVEKPENWGGLRVIAI